MRRPVVTFTHRRVRHKFNCWFTSTFLVFRFEPTTATTTTTGARLPLGFEMSLTTAPLKVKITREDGTSGERAADPYGVHVGLGAELSRCCFSAARGGRGKTEPR